ncbi:hypothetical protein TPHA_0H00490 [Tetrapisispora phaffii CBS 4417]|uniref:DNA endonuclease activator Ctp1 C-terminal domain-containing protein n=1 Tax=Tetrapisispora phaffii (strain ATCC 24235 / CBS 4417 / NBRC 1672 / NRRL Y-8282 / UCD 70-5) TaxID=1071381 RepID=G8BWV5_TETPH|nr:hypothetical protein TPHA_0H00490 [Tetrapisispora phaffii CBS 4417]CCE64259.1 hypothetical protein TPHA_0H00490 [Tetrapisispora phaffii CBS 4417]
MVLELALKDQLEDLNLEQLLEVQRIVTDLVTRKVHRFSEVAQVNVKNTRVADTDSSPLKDSTNMLIKTENDSDDNDFTLTQFNQINKENLFQSASSMQKRMEISKLDNKNTKEMSYLSQEVKLEDQSSPLKESQIINDSQESHLRIRLIDHNTPLNNKKIKQEAVSEDKTPQTAAVENYLDLSRNPINNKPWILEDFKPNEYAISRGKARHSKEQFMEQFVKGLGNLIEEKKIEGLPNSKEYEVELALKKNARQNEHEFDNLRDRSHSPPGFGRMDFPTTQERTDDKKKSQELIFQKTKYRFLMATRKDVPFKDREYHFKNVKFNRVIDSGEFTWTPSTLMIFSRDS